MLALPGTFLLPDMERPRQHVTDSLGENQFRSIFTSLGWTVNRVEHDYGIDFEIEIFQNSKSTGASFKVQLKSSESTQYSVDGNFISQVLDKQNAVYLCRELRAPVIVVHADVASRRTFWDAPQLNIAALDAFVKRPRAESLTLRIPTANELPSTLDGLMEAVGSAEMVLASRLVVSAPVFDFVDSIRGRIDEDEVVRQLRIKADAVSVSKLQQLYEAGNLVEARKRAAEVLADPASSVGTKFWTLLMAEMIEIRTLRAAGRQSERVSIQLSTSARLLELTRRGPAHLKFYAVIARKAAELESLAWKDFGLYMNWKVNEAGGDPFWKLQLTFERAALLSLIVRKYNQCIRLARYASNYKYQWALPAALVRIVVASSVLILRLNSEQLEDASRRFVQSCMAICKLAANIATNYHDDEALESAAIAAFFVTPSEGAEGTIWAAETLKKIGDPQARRRAEERLNYYIQTQKANEIQIQADKHFSVDDARQAYENMARALGIDLSDPHDRIADVVRIGLKDLDPSRVLKNCEHIFISLSFHGLPAEWLKLPTAGGKVIHCDLHKYAIEGLDLDGAYSFFRQVYCQKCHDCSPRPANWKYSMEWQEAENEKHEEFMRDFDQRRGNG